MKVAKSRSGEFPETAFLVIAVIAAWAGLVVQFIASLAMFSSPIAAAWRMLGYFTIITNIIAAVFFTTRLIHRSDLSRDWTNAPSVAAWVCVSITFVGLGFTILLARLYEFEGLAWWANGLLHYVTPALGLIYWLVFLRSGSLSWRDPLLWSTYVIAYGAYALIRGTMSGFYAYPFLDLPKIGVSSVATNLIGLLIAFCVVGLLFVFIGRIWPRAERTDGSV